MKTAIWRWFRAHRYLIIGVALLALGGDACVLFFRAIGLSHDVAIYAGLFTFVLLASTIARVAFRSHVETGETRMPKQSVLPPAAEPQKRDVTVNLRFSVDTYERLKAIAEFSNTGVASLLFYVTLNTTLPMMEKELKKAQVSTSQAAESPHSLAPDRDSNHPDVVENPE